MTLVIVVCGSDYVTRHTPEVSRMPMIEVTVPEGALAPEARDALLDELAGKLLAREGAPDTEFFRSITWVYVNEIDPATLAVGGRAGGEPRFRVNVTVPEGALSEQRKAGLIADVHDAIVRAAGLSDEDALRVWTLVRDVPEGNWGAGGQVVHYSQLVEYARAERASSQPAPA
jgi:phenylpyruvate tautomerase PptA (4-oxalocrotonate tautomerase family)